MHTHGIVTIVRILCIYFDQIIPLIFCHRSYRDKSELIFVEDPFFRHSIQRTRFIKRTLSSGPNGVRFREILLYVAIYDKKQQK